MPSIVSCTDRTPPSMMLIEAMARESKNLELFEKFNIPNVPLHTHMVEVKLTINGTEVDFVKTTQEMWDRLQRRHREDVEKEAKALVDQSRLSRLQEILADAEWNLQEEVKKLFDESLRS